MASRVIQSLLKSNNVKPLSTIVRQPTRFLSQAALEAKTLSNVPDTNLDILNNGMKIASENSGGSTCTVGIWVNAGSRIETPDNNGVAHFAEHMLFKGTSNRTQHEIELEIENMGAHLNAYTSREQQVYYAKCFTKDLPRAVNILADLIQNSKFDEGAIERERGVILREMQEVDTQLDEVIFDHLHATAYQGTPLGMTILGPSKNVKSISKQDLHDYVDTAFVAPRICLAAAGGVDHHELIQLAKSNFGGLEAQDPTKIDWGAPCRFTGSDIRIRDDDMPFAHVALAVQGCGWTSPDYFTMMVANLIHGNWNKAMGSSKNCSGTIAKNVSTLNLAQSYSSFNTCYTDTGLWGTYFVCDKMKLDDMTWNIQKEWMRICTGVTDAEVDRAKNLLKTSLLLQLDGSTQICEDIGRQVTVYGRRLPLTELNDRIEMIDANLVQNTADKYIYDKCLAAASLGPTEGMSDYNRMRGAMYWMRL